MLKFNLLFLILGTLSAQASPLCLRDSRDSKITIQVSEKENCTVRHRYSWTEALIVLRQQNMVYGNTLVCESMGREAWLCSGDCDGGSFVLKSQENLGKKSWRFEIPFFSYLPLGRNSDRILESELSNLENPDVLSLKGEDSHSRILYEVEGEECEALERSLKKVEPGGC